jgi:hypothetical protein
MLDMQGYSELLSVENDVAFALLNKEISGFLSTEKTVPFMTSGSGYTDVNMCVIRSGRVSVDRQLRRGIILLDVNPMSGVFRIIEPPPPHRPASVYPPAFGAGGGHTRWVERW